MARFGAAITDAEGLRLTSEEKAFFRDANPFGFILFARNIDTPEQVRALCAEMREAVGRDAPITIDQEGGRVQRMRAPIWTEWSAPLDFVAQAGAIAVKAMFMRYRLIASDLYSVGVDSNCAPLVDLALNLYEQLPIVVITSKPESRLGRVADVCIDTGDPQEDCLLGLSPTTSTTVMTVIGDALIVLMMGRIGFSNEEYAKRHHGGYLGTMSRKQAGM